MHQGEDTQVQMLWPVGRLEPPEHGPLPPTMTLRTARAEDEPAVLRLLAAAGWPGWDADRLRPWLHRMLPEGWIVLADARELPIATAMATHDPTWIVPYCAELGWVAVAPAHRGTGLGSAVTAAATHRMLACGYRVVHLYTETWRRAALKVYLRLGYVPFLATPDAETEWRGICNALDCPFAPSRWRADSDAAFARR